MEFHDKSVVITGAAGVFGRWITARFARDGAQLCLSDNRRPALDELACELDGGNSIGTFEPGERPAAAGTPAQ